MLFCIGLALIITLFLSILIGCTIGFSVWYTTIFEVSGIFLIVERVLSILVDIFCDIKVIIKKR